nr:hypothetical protein [Bdellovibrionales bacterium]
MNKLLVLTTTALISTGAFAQNVPLPDYNWSTDDIALKGITKEKLFKSMNRSMIKLGASICSNRALLWLHDFKRHHDVDGSKLFLFYTGKTGNTGETTWWYHVTPLVVENGVEYTIDAGFGRSINSPLLIKDWITKFAGSTNCKEIRANETDLIDRMFRGRVFPETTQYGTYDCYYKKVPAGYWTPASVAMNLLGVTSAGTATTFERPEINKNEVY